MTGHVLDYIRKTNEEAMLPMIDQEHPKAHLYEPSGLKRVHTPLTSTFYKNAIASGAITPPIGESAAVRRSDFMVGCIVCLFIAAGIGAFFFGMLWR